MGKHLFAGLLPEVDYELRVAVATEGVAALQQRISQFRIVEQLAVEHGDYGAGLVEQRLLSVGDAHNAETARRESDSRPNEIPLLVRTSMQQASRHAP